MAQETLTGAGIGFGFAFGGPIGAVIGGLIGAVGGKVVEVAENENLAAKAEQQGYRVYGQYCTCKECKKKDDNRSNKYDMSDKIVSITTRSCRIIHGSVSWALTAGKNAITMGLADPLEHWWTTIETEKGRYYQLQFRGNCMLIELRSCKTKGACDQQGLYEANKTYDADIWTENKYSYVYKMPKHTMGDVVKWMKSHNFTAHYKLLTHNCQDLCQTFYRRF
eukprot:549313_1